MQSNGIVGLSLVLGTALCFLAFLVGPTVDWKDHNGQVWGGEDCDFCLGWEGSGIGCEFDAGESIKCSLYPGEQSYDHCSHIPCVDPNQSPGEPVSDDVDDYQCPHSQVRELFAGNKRKITASSEAIRTKACFNDTSDGEEFCKCIIDVAEGGASKTYQENVPCFSVSNCFDDLGGCAPQRPGGMFMCANASQGMEGNAPNIVPHDDFPCPTQAQKDQAKQACEDANREE